MPPPDGPSPDAPPPPAHDACKLAHALTLDTSGKVTVTDTTAWSINEFGGAVSCATDRMSAQGARSRDLIARNAEPGCNQHIRETCGSTRAITLAGRWSDPTLRA